MFFEQLWKGGKRANLGEKRKFGSRWYEKTANGWKYVGDSEEGSGKKKVRGDEAKKREESIVKLAQEGKSSKEISQETGISPARIQQILSTVRKTGVSIIRKKKKETLYERFNYERRERKPASKRSSRADVKGVLQPYEKEGIKLGRAFISQKPDYDYLSEDIRGSLRAHQADFVNLALQKYEEGNKAFINSDSTGVGKTRQELTLAETYLEQHPDSRVLIVTESDRIIGGAFAKDGKALKIGVNVVKKGMDFDKGAGIYIIPYRDLVRLTPEQRASVDLTIMDECHNLKNASLSRKARIGIHLIKSSKHAALFSATPIDKAMHLEYLCAAYALDFKKVMKFLGYKRVGNQWQTNQPATITASKIDAFFQQFTEKGLMLKREIPLDGLEMTIKSVQLTPSYARKYNRMAHKMKLQLQLADKKERGLLKARWLMRIRGLLEEAKIEDAITEAKAALAEGRQVVLFATRVNDSYVTPSNYIPSEESRFAKLTNAEVGEIKTLLEAGHLSQEEIGYLYGVKQNTVSDIALIKTWKAVNKEGEVVKEKATQKDTTGTLKELEKRLTAEGIEHVSVFGSDKKAVKQLQEFQDGKKKVVITTFQSGGTGLNLDDTTGKNPRTAIVMTPPFSAVDFIQAPGRIHRLTTKSKSKMVMLSTSTGVEEWNKGIIANKLVALGASVKGDYEALDIDEIEKVSNLPSVDAQKYMKEKKLKGTFVPVASSISVNLNDFKETISKALKKFAYFITIPIRRGLNG